MSWRVRLLGAFFAYFSKAFVIDVGVRLRIVRFPQFAPLAASSAPIAA